MIRQYENIGSLLGQEQIIQSDEEPDPPVAGLGRNRPEGAALAPPDDKFSKMWQLLNFDQH